jgi:hypothetical protein
MLSKNPNWREIQQSFSQGDVEFEQDKRILDFFDDSDVMAIGDIDYFRSKIKISNSKESSQALLVINDLTSVEELQSFLQQVSHMDKICVSLNKFFIWTDTNNQALLDLIEATFSDRKIRHYYIKGLKGDNFNFASPTTQFFITNENN